MKHKIILLIFLVISVLLSVLGFILDLNERVQSITTNLLDIALMTLVIFTIITLAYTITFLVIRLSHYISRALKS